MRKGQSCPRCPPSTSTNDLNAYQAHDIESEDANSEGVNLMTSKNCRTYGGAYSLTRDNVLHMVNYVGSVKKPKHFEDIHTYIHIYSPQSQ